MNNTEIRRIALMQSAIDSACGAEDFETDGAKFIVSQTDARARKYLALPHALDIVSYGRGAVVSGRADVLEKVKPYAEGLRTEEIFAYPALNALSGILNEFGLSLTFMGTFFLPDVEKLKALSCPYELRVLEEKDFQNLYLEKWSNALCEKRRTLDRLCVGAYDGETLVGLAGASADCEEMWQIGVDVEKEYRRKGVASAMTTRLALEVLARGHVPFYSCLWSNVGSMRNALKCGFAPAWVQLTAGKKE